MATISSLSTQRDRRIEELFDSCRKGKVSKIPKLRKSLQQTIDKLEELKKEQENGRHSKQQRKV